MMMGTLLHAYAYTRVKVPFMTFHCLPGSFIFSQAWNLINSQSVIFDEWLPRAVKIIGKCHTSWFSAYR